MKVRKFQQVWIDLAEAERFTYPWHYLGQPVLVAIDTVTLVGQHKTLPREIESSGRHVRASDGKPAKRRSNLRIPVYLLPPEIRRLLEDHIKKENRP